MRKAALFPITVAILLTTSCGRVPPPLELAAPNHEASVEQGRGLVQGLAACGLCHGGDPVPNSPLAGGRTLTDHYGEIKAPNITQSRTGNKGWGVSDIIGALRSAKRPSGEEFSSTAHRGFEWLSDESALAIASYIRSLSPVENHVERRSVGFIDRNTTGFFVASSRLVQGYVPAISKDNKIEYGQYLVDHVARCTNCHSTPATLLSDGRYLGGGSVTFDGDKRDAPNISNSEIEGIGSWSEEQIVSYLKSGITPDGRESDSHYCPTEFYAQAEASDLAAIAAFLKQATAQQGEGEIKDDGIRKIGGVKKDRPKRSDQFRDR